MNSKSSKRGFEHNIHVARGVAILLIIGAHTIPSLDWSLNAEFALVLDKICNQASIIFFFIAGYLFQHLSYRFTARAYYRSKLFNVIIPYVIVSLPAIYIYTHITQRTGMYSGFYDESLFYQVFFFLITGKHMAPLWFVPTISLFYLLAPLLIRLDRYKAFYLCLPLLFLAAVIHGRGGQFGPIDKAIYLAPAYISGMAFSHYRQSCYEFVRRNWAVMLILSLGLFGALLMDLPKPPHLQILFKMLVATLLIVALQQFPDLLGSKLDYIAQISFGLFFVHDYVIGFLKVAYAYAMTGTLTLAPDLIRIPGTLLTFAACHIFVTAVSIAIIWGLQKKFGPRSRMLVGA